MCLVSAINILHELHQNNNCLHASINLADVVDDRQQHHCSLHTGPCRPTSGLKCESWVLDANITGQAGISDTQSSHTAQRINCWYSGCVTARFLRWSSERLVTSPFVTTGSDTESANPGEVKLLIRSYPFLRGQFGLLYYGRIFSL